SERRTRSVRSVQGLWRRHPLVMYDEQRCPVRLRVLEKQGEMSMKLAKAALLFTLASGAAWAQVNVGEQKPEAGLPFTMTTVTTLKLPWRLAFLPDCRMLITEV